MVILQSDLELTRFKIIVVCVLIITFCGFSMVLTSTELGGFMVGSFCLGAPQGSTNNGFIQFYESLCSIRVEISSWSRYGALFN